MQAARSSRIIGEQRERTSEALGSAYRSPAIISSESPEFVRLAEELGLKEGYEHARETQIVFGLVKPNEVPDFEAVRRALTLEMLQAAQSFQSPELVLTTKDQSFDDLVSAMNAHKTMPKQKNVYADDLFKPHAIQRSENWAAHIIEAPTKVDVQDFDDLDLTLSDRIERFAKYKEGNNVNGMDRIKYLHLMMQRLQSGEPIDQKFWTMLDEDPALSDIHVPLADWNLYDREVDFDWGRPEDPNRGARFRRSVGGDVQNT